MSKRGKKKRGAPRAPEGVAEASEQGPEAPRAEPARRAAPGPGNNPFAEALRGISAPKRSTPARASTPGAARHARLEAAPRHDERFPRSAPARSAAVAPFRSPGESRDERMALKEAYRDVLPLKARSDGARRAEPPRPASRAEESAEARASLGRLVGGAVHFAIERDAEGEVEALREGMHRSHLGSLRRAPAPQSRIDLHGLRAEEAARRLNAFVRQAHGQGHRLLLVVHGQGHHSEPGGAVLGERALDELTKGAAAPWVAALCTAPRHLGGRGALLISLDPRAG